MRVRITAAAIGACVLAALATTALAGNPTARTAQSVGKGVLFAVLTGNKEVDLEGERGAGDRNGRGSFTAIVDGGQLCYAITVKNITDPIAAHIHRGGAAVSGDVVLPLGNPATGDPGVVSECIAISAGLATAINANPQRFYINVHTNDFGGGAVRGQLLRRTR